MAPSGPRRGASSSTTRTTRSSTTIGGKASARGGINKRRGPGAGKIDRDGDLDMDTPVVTNGSSHRPKRGNNHSVPAGPATRSSRTGTVSSRSTKPLVKSHQHQIIEKALSSGSVQARVATGMSSRSSRQTNASHSVTLKVLGLKSSRAADNEGGGLKELLTFLERKAQTVGKTSRAIRIKKSQLNGDFVYITASKDDAEEIMKLNDFAFAGTTLQIAEATEGTPQPNQNTLSSTASEVKDQLRNVLSLRYDVGAKLLNLSTLGEDAVLNQMGFFSGESTPEKLFRALMAICEMLFKTPLAKREAVISISLAGNNIDDVLQIMALSDTFPDLINLDLSRNHFKDLKGLQKWRHRLRNIETLLLNDNPIESLNPNYSQELVAWFPKLQNLSGVQVRTAEQVAAAVVASRPTPIPQRGADFRDINRIGEGFITEFLRLYDSDRHNLAAKYYDAESTFSVAVNVRSPHAPNVQPPTWGSYIKFSRNHTKITHLPARQQRVFRGTNLIQGVWRQLPATRHPNLATQFDKYIIDCHPVSYLADPTGQSPTGADGMIITMHGEFEDQEPDTLKTAKRSFSRTFVLGPGVPGVNPIRVISDMLSLKVYHPAPTPTPTPTLAQEAPQNSEDIQKQQMVMELCKQTGMTPEYSTLCFEGANWNFDQALASFNEKRAQLPPRAFATAA